MRSPLAWRLFHRTLLLGASLLVPGSQRAEWIREWRGELWHVRQSCLLPNSADRRSQSEVTAFCLGAFQDALCLRRAGRPDQPFFTGMRGTPQLCLLMMAAILASTYTIALLLPGVRAERNLRPQKVNPNLVLIRDQGTNNRAVPTISPSEFHSWEVRKQQYFDALAFYQVRQRMVGPVSPARARDNAVWGVAHASSNLFTLLGLPIWFTDAGTNASSDTPQLILSERVWKNEFGADPHVTGTLLHLGHQTGRIAGVAADDALGLPGRIDAWLLDPDAPDHEAGPGFVVAHLTPDGVAQMWGSCVSIAANGPDGSEYDLLGVSLDDCRPSTMSIYLFGLLLALLSLPAITSVSLGEYSVNPQKTSWIGRLQRRSLQAAKSAQLAPIV